MNKVKFQHYVPRFYLEKFSNADGYVWVYDKQSDKAYPKGADAIGGQKYFYDVSKLDEAAGFQVVETFFHSFEASAGAILINWLAALESGACFEISSEERMLFSRFLATQLIRTPNHRKFIMQMGAMLHKIEVKAFLETRNPELAELDFDIHWRKEVEPAFHAEQILDLEILDECAFILSNHIWVVVRNPSEHTLYTSDNPVIRKPHKQGGWRSYSGYGSEGIQLIFPLSPQYSLSLLEKTFWRKFDRLDGKEGPWEMTAANVEHDNSGQVQQSNRFVFCQQDNFQLAREFCAQFPDVRDPDRPLVSKG